MVPVYFINLASSRDRRSFMERQFKALGITAERVEGVTPDDLTPQQINSYCNPLAALSMAPGQYACNLSHAKAWRAFLATDAPRALFLEDDAILSASLPRFLDHVDGRPEAIIRIETWPSDKKPYAAEADEFIPGIQLRSCLARDAGAAGYLLTREAAIALLADPHFHTTLVDGLLFNPLSSTGRKLVTRYTDPGLCVQLCNAGISIPESTSRIGAASGNRDYGQMRRKRGVRARAIKQIGIWLSFDLPRAVARIRHMGTRRITMSIPFRAD